MARRKPITAALEENPYQPDTPAPDVAPLDPGAVAAMPSLADELSKPQATPSLTQQAAALPGSQTINVANRQPTRLEQLYAQQNPPPLTGKQQAFRSLALALPTVAGALGGGLYGAAGAAQGTAGALETEREQQNIQRAAVQKEIEGELGRQAHAQDIEEQIKGREATTAAIVAGRGDVVDKLTAQRMAKDAADNATKEALAKVVQDTNLRKNDQKLDPVSGQPVPMTLEDYGPQTQQKLKNAQVLEGYRQAQMDLDKAKTDLASNPDNPMNKQKYDLAIKKINAQAESAAAILGLRREALTFQESKADEPKPTQQLTNQSAAADRTKKMTAAVRAIVSKKPYLIGPVLGRINMAGQVVGGNPLQSKEDEQDAATLSGHLAYLFANELQGTMTGRPNPQVVGTLKAASAQMKDDPSVLEGFLKSADNNADIALQTGKQYGVKSKGGLKDELTVRVQIPGRAPGTISKDKLQQFLKDNPGAKVLP